MITNDNYLRLSMIINTICLYIVPVFTYTLFIELSNVTDLILNCLTGEFLINIDNLIVDFIGVEDYVKALTKDLLVYSFLKTGYPSKNIMEGNTLDLWLITFVQIIQMFVLVYDRHCICLYLIGSTTTFLLYNVSPINVYQC